MRAPTGSRAIAVPVLLDLRAGAAVGLGAQLHEVFHPARVVVVTGAAVSKAIGEGLAADLRAADIDVEHLDGLAGTLAEAARLLDRLDDAPASLVVAVGGGQPIDVAKLAAHRADIPMVAVPTILSHDGMASPVASLVAADGRRRSIGARMPAGVVVDLAVVGAAPERFVRAGIGDLVSNITAVDDWRAAAAAAGETFDEFAASIALMSAEAVLDVAWPLDDDDLASVARGLVMSGLAMEVAGSSRPCSGAEHLVSHALDELRGPAASLHGEHVALGVLIALAIQAGPHETRVRRLLERIGFTGSLDSWGLDEDLLVAAVQRAPSTRPGRRTALDQLDLGDAPVRELVRRALGGPG